MQKSYNKENILWKIITKQLTAEIVYESEHTLAIYDINPKAIFHVLLLPKNPYINLVDFLSYASFEEKNDFEKSLLKVINILEFTDNAFNITINNGENAGQEIMHLHYHLMGE